VGKRFSFLLVLLLVAGLATMVYFLIQGRKDLLSDPYKAVPSDACFIIETVDLQSFINSVTSGSGIMGEMGKIKDLDRFNSKVKILADQVNNTGYQKIMNSNSAVISFHISPEGKVQPLLSIAVLSNARVNNLKEILRSSGIKTLEDLTMGGIRLIGIPYSIDNNRDTVYISLNSGLLVCSTSSGLMKASISHMAGANDIRRLPGFSKVMQASGKNEDKIFIIFSNLIPLLKKGLTEDYFSTRNVAKLTEYAVADIYFNQNGLVLSGYTESTDSTQILYKYKSGTASAFETYKILPSTTMLFESVIPLAGKSSIVPPQPLRTATVELAQKLKEYMGDEITRAYIDLKDGSGNTGSVIIYELTNRVYAEKIFLDYFGQKENKGTISYFNPDDQINIPVYQTVFKGLVSLLAPGFSIDFDDSYFTFYDNYLITGNSDIALSKVLYDNLLKKTLANDLIYREFESTLPSVSGYFFYCVPSQIIEYLSSFLSEDVISFMKSGKSSISKIQAAGYQFTPSNNMIYNSFSVLFKEEPREESTTEWETLLDSIAAIKPFFFTNHTTGAKEIFIQDLKNNAYLINAAGRILWKVPLRERITGSVFMIDYYRNGKYQLLFSGENYLHLLDRNGNYVERYPVKLRSPATNSVALFDYDNNNNYRLLIAGQDKMIYTYDKSGNIVKGWKPFRTNGTVSSEISWFRVSGKDYIVIADETSLYFLDRQGNPRLTLKEPVTKAAGSSLRLTPGSTPSVVCSAPDGTVQHIYFDGSVRKFNKKAFSVDHSFDFFDVNGDGFGEYIFIDKGMLYLYDHNRSELFSRKFGSSKLGGPINFIFSSADRKIGVIDIEKKQIYLIDDKGNIMKGFPLRGASMFSIGRLNEKNEWHLIVGGTDKFMYNYRLDTQ
jgi:WD40 repeat protein